MPIYETFSKRLLKQQRAGQVDVYQYENLPAPFRQKVVYLLNDALEPMRLSDVQTDYGILQYFAANGIWKSIHDTIAREYGLPHLGTPNLKRVMNHADTLVIRPTKRTTCASMRPANTTK